MLGGYWVDTGWTNWARWTSGAARLNTFLFDLSARLSICPWKGFPWLDDLKGWFTATCSLLVQYPPGFDKTYNSYKKIPL
jgi:hypothetical protein